MLYEAFFVTESLGGSKQVDFEDGEDTGDHEKIPTQLNEWGGK